MYITITDFKSKWHSNITPKMVLNYINTYLVKSDVEIGTAHVDLTRLLIKRTSDNKLFRSTKDNRITLKEGDKRIKKDKNYLLSKNLTKKQMEEVILILGKGLSDIGVDCCIKLYEHSDDDKSFILLRGDGVSDLHKIAMIQNSFPEGGVND